MSSLRSSVFICMCITHGCAVYVKTNSATVTGLTAHYDANSLTTADGAAVSTWSACPGLNVPDFKGYGTVTMDSDGINGGPGVYVGGGAWSDVLQTDDSGGADHKRWSIALVYMGDPCACSNSCGQPVHYLWDWRPDWDSSWYYGNHHGPGGHQNRDASKYINGAPYAKTSSECSSLFTGTPQILINVAPSPNTGKAITLFGRYTRNENVRATIGELLVYDYELSASDAKKLSCQLGQKWSITVSGCTASDYTPSLIGSCGATTSPTSVPTPVPAQPAPLFAKGDPHMTNVFGQRFDLMQPGTHSLVHIPRYAKPRHTLLDVKVDVKRMGRACGDMYIQQINVTGAWASTSRGRGGLFYSVHHPPKTAGWQKLRNVFIKVVHGHTKEGVSYLNFFVRDLDKLGYTIGGLLGMDDHSAATVPDPSCIGRVVL